MADYIDHMRQAEHNEEFAESLIRGSSRFYDWAIIASFYSAVHYVEADFSQDSSIRHTEISHGKTEKHLFRQNMVRRKYGNSCWSHYRKLRSASEMVRYLAVNQVGTGTDFYSLNDAENFLNTNLQAIKKTLGL